MDAWPKWPWRLKIFLVLSLFLASGSVASLSETIIKWKGFILDAVLFYKTYYNDPLNWLFFQIFSIQPPKYYFDTVTMVVLCVSANIRVIIYSRWPRFSVRDVTWELVFLLYVVLAELFPHDSLGLTGLIAPVSVYVLMLISYFTRRGAERILGIAFLCLPFCAVGILGAINAGLTKN